MFDRFERPIKIICLAMAMLLAWQLVSLIVQGNPFANLKIPALPALRGTPQELAKSPQKGTNIPVMAKADTNAIAASTNAHAAVEMGQMNVSFDPQPGNMQTVGQGGGMNGRLPGRMHPMLIGGMPGGMKKIELPPEVQARVDRIIDSEIFGPVIRPMPVALIGIADEEAFIRATNGQSGPITVGGEMGGIKLLRIGINRVLIEQDGEKKELTIFDGIGGESLMPKSVSVPSNNAPANQTFSSKQKETQ